MELDTMEQFSRELGADFYGVADLAAAREAIEEQGGSETGTYPKAISVGIELIHSIIDQLPRSREKRAMAVSYQHHCYDVVTQRLDIIASRIASTLQRDGYRVLPVPTSERVDDQRICAIFSHKLAAHLAGLGWIGKSCLLVTPEAGPRVRWTTILTDAPLTPGKPMDVQCKGCTQCVDACPVSALTGRAFQESESRESRFDARKCQEYLKGMKKEGRLAVCGMCLYACPHGRLRNKRFSSDLRQ